jgi:hypothetical protein
VFGFSLIPSLIQKRRNAGRTLIYCLHYNKAIISPEEYKTKVENYFEYLANEFGFELMHEKLHANVFYDVQYRKANALISISYENVEDYLAVVLFVLSGGRPPDYDNKRETLHLENLAGQIFPTLNKDEIQANSKRFEKFRVDNEIERKILKSAKDLRLCLLHLNQILLG